MGAQVWRSVRGQVKSSGLAVIEDRGYLRSAATDSNGDYLFSEVGAGVQPLVITGEPQEVRNWFSRQCLSRTWAETHGFKNIIRELPEIYLTVQKYEPGARFVGLFPANDIAQAIFNKVCDRLGDSIKGEVFQHLFGREPRSLQQQLSRFAQMVASEGYAKVFDRLLEGVESVSGSVSSYKDAMERLDFDNVAYTSKVNLPDVSGQVYLRFHYLAEGDINLDGTPIQKVTPGAPAKPASASWFSGSWFSGGKSGAPTGSEIKPIEVLLGRGFVSFANVYKVIKAYLPRT